MAFSGDGKDGRELRVYENLDELKVDLVEYIAKLSDAAVKERGTFAIALSGGSVIGLIGYLFFSIFVRYLVCLFFFLILSHFCFDHGGKQGTLSSSLQRDR